MASDREIAAAMNSFLRARGYTCGRNYADVGGLATGISSQFPAMTHQALASEIRKVARIPEFRFKVADDRVSASDPECGT